MPASKKKAPRPAAEPDDRTINHLFARSRDFAPKIIEEAGVFNLGSDEAFAAFTALGFPEENRAMVLCDEIFEWGKRNNGTVRTMAFELDRAVGRAAIEARDAGYALGLAVGLHLAKGQIGGAR
jgi:hypothetical protein